MDKKVISIDPMVSEYISGLDALRAMEQGKIVRGDGLGLFRITKRGSLEYHSRKIGWAGAFGDREFNPFVPIEWILDDNQRYRFQIVGDNNESRD